MARRTTFQDIIKLWAPGEPESRAVRAFSSDTGIGFEAARKMLLRGSISGEHWAAIERAAAQRKIKTLSGESVTVDLLAQIAARRRRKRAHPNKTQPIRSAA